MADINHDLLHTIYKALQKRDTEVFGRYLADDARHHIHVPIEVHPIGGLRTGKVAIIERMNEIARSFTTLSFAIDDLLVGNGRAAARVRVASLHRISGEQYRGTVVHFWTFHDGLITGLDEYHDMGDVLGFTERAVERV
ncbi:MAG: nuclear transport factor 2 family protein [Hyphomicrobiales bacterium]